MRSERRWLLALTALAVLAGCRTTPPLAPPATTWEARRAQLQARTTFQFKGRVAVATGSDGFNANLHWNQDGARTQLTLEGPLGVGGAQVTATGNDLTLVTARGEHIDSDAAHAQLAARLGFDPPLVSLRYWVLGVPDPGQPATEDVDQSQQHLLSLIQAGWRVDYTGYATSGGESLPARLTLARDPVRVRLVVDAWQ
jgi:outer membrane lipoprotein LolB